MVFGVPKDLTNLGIPNVPSCGRIKCNQTFRGWRKRNLRYVGTDRWIRASDSSLISRF
jgi:hypothetical protein